MQVPFMRKLYKSFLILTSIVLANDFGFISGVVTDKVTGEPLPGVQIVVEKTDCGAVTNLDGVYEIYRIPPGKHELFVEYLGYTSIRILNVQVVADSITKLDIAMDQGNF